MRRLLGTELPIIQAPMAGVQASALAIAVSNAGGLGSLPCAMLGLEALRDELAKLKAHARGPCNVNFFCHAPPVPDARREETWRAALAPYYAEYGIDPATIPAGPGRAPFSHEAADVLESLVLSQPENPQYLARLVQRLADLGRTGSAQDYLARLERFEPDSSRTRQARAALKSTGE